MTALGKTINLWMWIAGVIMGLLKILDADFDMAVMFFMLVIICVNTASALER